MSFTGPKLRCWQDCIAPGGSKGGSVSWPFSAYGSCLRSLARGPFIFRSVFSTLRFSCPHLKDPCGNIGPPHVVQDTLHRKISLLATLLSSTTLIPICCVTSHGHRSQYLGLDIFEGAVSLPTTHSRPVLAPGHYSFLFTVSAKYSLNNHF